ncbi:hypothetical protein OSTOST_19451, partial [Ostertagia ostertagi]
MPSSPTPELSTTTTERPATTTSTAPSTTTVRKQMLRFDILFLIDVSKEAKGRLDEMSGFVTSVMSAYDVSQWNARVALVAVGSDAMGSEPIANFDSIDSNQDMLHYINLMYNYTDFKHEGQ